jgi:chemotaxis protein methyltransferase CheR
VIGTDDVDRFRSILTGWLGLTLDGTATDTLAGLLAERVAAAGRPPAAYLDRLAAERPPAELEVLAERLTIAETYFLRHEEQFRALADVVVPARVQAREPDRTLRVLSMGCATGEEPYTVAIVVRDALLRQGLGPGWSVSVVGVDVNPAVLRRAQRGRFGRWSLRATPDAVLRRWFRPDGDRMVLDGEIRRTVRFVAGNLADEDARWWSPGTYDVVFCRNVIMYLTPEHAAAAVARLVASLAPGGFLFLGHAETAHGRTAGIDLRHSHDTFYFQRGGHAPAVAEPARPPGAPPAARRAGLASRPPVRRPIRSPAMAAQPARPARPGGPGGPTQRALDLLRLERFEDAFAEVAAEAGPEAVLLRAVLLTDLGRLAEAEAECHRLIDADGLDAGAHYLLAVCREGAGDLPTALSHAGTAAYLDPGFAMPRLRLGLFAQRRGDLVAARHEFTAALTLLAGESDRRVLLFGGGFTRSALTTLCRAGLAACGSAA